MTSKKSFNTKIYLAVLIFAVAIIPSMIAVFFYYLSERSSIAGQACRYEEQILKDMKNNFHEIDTQLDKIQYEVTSQFLTLNADKISLDQLREGDIEKIHILENQLQSIRRTTTGISNIYIISRTGDSAVYSSTYSFNRRILFESAWLNHSYNTSQDWEVAPDHPADYLISSGSSSDASCFSFITGMINKDGDNTFEYLLQVDIASDYLYSLIQGIHITSTDAIFAFDSDGTPVFRYNADETSSSIIESQRDSTSGEGSDIQTIQNGPYILSKAYIPEVQLDVCKLSWPFTSMDTRNLTLQFGFLVLVSIGAAAAVSARITRSFVRPFEQLIEHTMISISTDARLENVEVHSRSSYIQEMAGNFNALIDRINLLIQNILAQENEKQELKIKMLQAQINPHFLYNTLNSVKWMALMKNETEIADMTTALIDLLEYCFKDSKSLVTLGEELRFLQNYVRIQQMRTQDTSVRIIFDIPEEVCGLKIIKFSVQPAVENAFLHAFPSPARDAHIILRGRMGGGKLILQIEDNGIGFDSSVIRKSMTGIGIQNVDDRIRLTFGEQYGQKITSTIGKGTIVTIEQPVITDGISNEGSERNG